MDFPSAIFWLIAMPLLFLIVILSVLFIKIFTGKSIGDPSYAPTKGTVFNQLFYFDHLYDYQTQIAKTLRTFRLLNLSHSEVLTTDVRNIEHILKTNFDKYAKGKYFQEIVSDLWGQGIFAMDGDKWRQQRKLASYEFSTRNLRDFSCSVFRKNAAKLVTEVSKMAMSGQVIEFQDMFMKCAMESITKVGFGIDLNCMDSSSSNEEAAAFIKALDDANEWVSLRFFDPFWKLKRSLNIGYEASLKNNIKVVDNFIYNIMNTKKKLLAINPNNVKEDILSRFLAERNKNPGTITDQYLRDIILNFLLAGKDSTGITLCWFFYMLCKNPLIQEKVAQEVIDITGGKENDANLEDFVATITEATLEKMHYLHASLAETLRLYPVIPVDGRCAEVDDIWPDGHKIKRGDQVWYIAYAMGRMSYVWGEDAENFRPERWLKDGVFQPESPFKFISFHAGPRICLGKEFAYRQMKISSIVLIRYFCFKLADGTKDVTYKITATLPMKGGLHLCVVPRTTLPISQT